MQDSRVSVLYANAETEISSLSLAFVTSTHLFVLYKCHRLVLTIDLSPSATAVIGSSVRLFRIVILLKSAIGSLVKPLEFGNVSCVPEIYLTVVAHSPSSNKPAVLVHGISLTIENHLDVLDLIVQRLYDFETSVAQVNQYYQDNNFGIKYF